MHDTAALIERHVVGEDSGRLRIEKWMLELHAFQIRAFPLAVHFVNFHVQFGFQSVHAVFRQQQFSGRRVGHDVFVLRMKRQRAVRRQSPRSSGPDQSTDVVLQPF